MSTSECNLPEPDSGYFSPRNDTEELFTFDEDLSVAYQPKISKKESARRPAETQSCLDLDMSKGSVYRRRRRSFSDPFPRPASKGMTLDISKVPHENKPSTESKLVQTCQRFTTSASCRCSSCYSTPSIRPVAVVQPLRRMGLFRNPVEDDQLTVNEFAVRLRNMADEFDNERAMGANHWFDVFRLNFRQIFAEWVGM